MPAYDLSSPGAVSASAEQARIRAGQEPDQNSYNAAWLHGYASALANVADTLEARQELVDAIIGFMGEQYPSAELYGILHGTLAMSDQEIRALGFDLPQCREPSQANQHKKFLKKKGIRYER